MRSKSILVVVITLFVVIPLASADIIRGIDIELVTIGNAGNPGDSTGFGAVDYEYRIGKYEITAAQWQTINAVAGIGGSGTWSGNLPVASISWYDAARFCNYLTTGNTENGVYGFTAGSLTNIMGHEQAGSTYSMAYFLPTEDEWYKAAYYTGSGYSLYSNGLDTIPAADNGWNYFGGSYNTPWDVGTGTEEQNGTFDMGGNVFEWNEALYLNPSSCVIRGGAFTGTNVGLASSYRNYYNDPENRFDYIGFRVASIPEPTTLLLLALGAVLLCKRR